MRRLPFDSAVVRSSKLGCEAASCGTASMSAVRTPSALQSDRETRAHHAAADDGDVEAHSCLAHAACTSRSTASGVFSRAAVSTSGAPSVTSTSSSMRTPMFQNSFGTRGDGTDVDAGLDGQRHAGLEHPPLAADLVVAHVVHVQDPASVRCGD